MKKTLFKIFALMLVCCTLFAFSSCEFVNGENKKDVPEPEFDLYAAYENLMEQDYYYVKYYNGSNSEDKLVFEAEEIYGVKSAVVGMKRENDYSSIANPDEILNPYWDFVAIKFETEGQAETYYLMCDMILSETLHIFERQKNIYEGWNEHFDDSFTDEEMSRVEFGALGAKVLVDEVDDVVVGQSGRVIWLGKKNCINDTKGKASE